EREDVGFEVVESVGVDEDIKVGKGRGDVYMEDYEENMGRLGRDGVKVICYKLMGVVDWTRTEVDLGVAAESTTLVY
uniref:mannonate dehydratase n=1 Tax=Bacillus altitudinis TaxID=293387 RepID=UPI001643BC17